MTMRPMRMTAYMNGRRYSTDAATLLAYGEEAAEGSAVKATFLFRTRDGLYFVQRRTSPQRGDPHSERVWIEPISELDAIPLFAELEHQQGDFHEAFGDGQQGGRA